LLVRSGSFFFLFCLKLGLRGSVFAVRSTPYPREGISDVLAPGPIIRVLTVGSTKMQAVVIASETSFYFSCFFSFSVTLIRAGRRKEMEAPGTREKVGARKVAKCGGDSPVDAGRYSPTYRKNSNDAQTLGMTTNTFAAELSLGQVLAYRKTNPPPNHPTNRLSL